MHVRLAPSQYYGQTIKSLSEDSFVVTETRCETGLDVPSHEHQRPYVCFVLAGAYRESHGLREYECGALKGIYRPAGYAHANVISPSGALCLNIEFESCGIDLPRDPHQVWLPEFSRTAFRIFRELRVGDQDSRLSMESHIGYLCSLLNLACERDETRLPKWIAEAKEKLREGVSESWSLRRLAEEAAVHPVHFCRQFHKTVGLSIGEFVRHTRIERAISMLPEPSYSLGEIAAEVGFADQAHFARTFRQISGMSPKQYRQTLLN